MRDAPSIYIIPSYHGQHPNCKEGESLKFRIYMEEKSIPAKEAENGEMKNEEEKQRNGCHEIFYLFFSNKEGWSTG